MARKVLTNKVVMQVWNSIDKPSLRRVKEETGKMGYINPITERPYSRQWIKVLMSETPEGRMKLTSSPHSHRITPESKTPVIVEGNPKILAWYREHGFLGYPVIAPDKVTVQDVAHRMVYGDLPVSLARHARSVWLPSIEGNECLLTEYKIQKNR